MACHPAGESHCSASVLGLAAGHRQGGQPWRRGLSVREAPAKGRAGPREEGRKATGRSQAEPQPQRHLGRGMGRERAWLSLSASQIATSLLGNPSPGFVRWWGSAEVTYPSRTEKLPASGSGITSNSPVRAGDAALGSSPHIFRLKVSCLLNLDPAAVWEACFPWLKLRKPSLGPSLRAHQVG